MEGPVQANGCHLNAATSSLGLGHQHLRHCLVTADTPTLGNSRRRILCARRRVLAVQEGHEPRAHVDLRLPLASGPTSHEAPACHWNVHCRTTKRWPTFVALVRLVAPFPHALPRPHLAAILLLQPVLHTHQHRLLLSNVHGIFPFPCIICPIGWRRRDLQSRDDRCVWVGLKGILKSGVAQVPEHPPGGVCAGRLLRALRHARKFMPHAQNVQLEQGAALLAFPSGTPLRIRAHAEGAAAEEMFQLLYRVALVTRGAGHAGGLGREATCVASLLGEKHLTPTADEEGQCALRRVALRQLL
mmetsp:Transcript_9100/g.25420  ORF Transcript_9100/g.25420 Transcript_9100/m.25420 type:complete len:301 (-) Transcript_9100:534-1436(-)